MSARALGARGEAIAAAWLEEHGYRVLDRNFRTRFGEIDLIARQGRELVFIEVKTRRGRRFGTPAEAVDARKRRCWMLAAEVYLARRGRPGVPFRFDFVGVDLSGDAPRVELVPDAIA